MNLTHYLALSCILLASQALGALPPRIETVLKKNVVTAYRSGDLAASQRLLSNLVEKLTDDQLESADEILADQQTPGLAELVLDARMTEVLTNGKNLGRPGAQETARAMPVLSQRIRDLLEDVREMEVFADELPDFDSMQQYQDAFWEIHVATNRLTNAGKMVRYGAAFVNRSKLSQKRREAEKDDENASSIDFAALRDELKSTLQDLTEIKAELRINAVTKATNIIRESDDFKERLRAVYVVDFDGPQVINFLRENADGTKFKRPRLQDSQTRLALETAVQYARETAGDLGVKSRLLYLGMHWWLRGRYGQGPYGGGLLKSPAALSSPMAQFPLYMPMTPPTPIDPTYAGYSVPKFDRRHHYIWMYEYRQINSETTEQTNVLDEDRSRDIQVNSKTKLSRFY